MLSALECCDRGQVVLRALASRSEDHFIRGICTLPDRARTGAIPIGDEGVPASVPLGNQPCIMLMRSPHC